MEDVDILFTSLCCGYGKMDEDVSIQQIMDARAKSTRATHILPKIQSFAIKPEDIKVV